MSLLRDVPEELRRELPMCDEFVDAGQEGRSLWKEAQCFDFALSLKNLHCSSR